MGMIALILAQRSPVDIDGWIEIILAILVFGGAAFAAIAKKLIAAFTPDETDKTKIESVKPEGDDVTPVSPPRPARPAYPVARPMPPQPGAPSTSAPPMVQPYPRRPGARSVTEVTPVEPSLGPAVEAPRTRAVPEPSLPRRPRRPAPATSVPGLPPRVSRPAPLPQARPLPPKSAAEGEPTEDTFDHIHPEVELEHIHPAVEREHLHPDDDLGHLDPEAHLGHMNATVPTKAAGQEALVRAGMVAPFSRDMLRRAIVMNEILGPPVALRDFSGSQ